MKNLWALLLELHCTNVEQEDFFTLKSKCSGHADCARDVVKSAFFLSLFYYSLGYHRETPVIPFIKPYLTLSGQGSTVSA